jgi:Domain of unknown function (DUF1905)
MGCYEFSAELWIWDARREDSWTFLSVPIEESEEIRACSASEPRGIGEQLANQLAVRRSNLHLIDRDEVHLAAVAGRIARDNPAVTVRADIGQRDASWVVLADPEGNEFCILRGRVRPDS